LPGRKAPSCNCERELPIRESGLCQECYAVAAGKRGSSLMNALTVFRAKTVKVDPVPTGKIDVDPEFVPPKVVGKVALPGKPDKAIKPKVNDGIRVIDEAGKDVGSLRSYAAQMPDLDRQPISVPMPARRHNQIVPHIKRAVIIEVGDVEIEFRAGCAGLDIKVDDGTGVIFFAQDMPLSFIAELQQLAEIAKECA